MNVLGSHDSVNLKDPRFLRVESHNGRFENSGHKHWLYTQLLWPTGLTQFDGLVGMFFLYYSAVFLLMYNVVVHF